MSENNNSSYQIVIVLVVSIAAFSLNFIGFQAAGLAPQIIQATGATAEQFGLIMGMALLGGVILGIPCGALGDRFGVKSIVALGLIASLIGVVGRYAASPAVNPYIGWMFLVGIGIVTLNANFVKVLGMWLPPQKIGFSVGCYLAGIGLGQSSAVAVGPLFASLESAFMVSIVIMVVVVTMWFLFLKDAPAGAPKIEPQPLLVNLKYAMTKPTIWIAGLSGFFMLGSYVTLNSFLVNSLISVKGVEPDKAGLTASVVALSLMIGSLMSSVMVKKVGRSKIFMLLCGSISTICMYLAWSMDFSGATVVMLFGIGFFSGALLSVVLSLPMLLDYIGPRYAGSAGGIISTLQTGGGFALPVALPILAQGEVNGIFTLMTVGFGLMTLFAIILPELLTRPKD
jgi:NNP family nitrate/nitrite transporter-like MFS transporter